ncbi:DUF1573 domain-containing protein [Bacteroides cellulosilyticus]|uniref:DUF1573 domain-containing protein n=1 Tax=Bacteroides cellulosilyticus TaxID=246787 RepID=UPI0032BFCA48
MKKYIVLLWALFLIACSNSRKQDVITLLQDWEGREVRFPNHPVFTVQGRDTVNFQIEDKCKIITYVDSTGCTSCKLKFSEWKELMNTIDSLRPDSVQFLFFFFPKRGTEIYQSLLADRFKYPVCIDEEDSLNKLNSFPSDMAFQTFLLDKDNKVKAIGNPVHNPKIKELYMKILMGEETTGTNEGINLMTEVSIDSTSLSLGDFDWEKEQKVVFTLKNTGNKPLVIDAVSTSCGCTEVEYDKEPVRPESSMTLYVAYKAEHPEHFNKTITVYCNTKASPLLLKIMGNAE